MNRKFASVLSATLFLFLTATVSQASRVYIIGTFVPTVDSAIAYAGQYSQVYVSVSTDVKGVVTGQTSVAGSKAHVWGSATGVDLSDYLDPADGPSDTVTVQTAIKWTDPITGVVTPGTSTLALTRDVKGKPWFVTVTVNITDALGVPVVISTGVAPFVQGTWLCKK